MAYTVVKGDTLGAIAKANNMSLSELLKLNPDIKDPNMISIGLSVNVSSTEEGSGGGGTGTSEKFDLNGVPGSPDVWSIGGKDYLVYQVPDSDPPAYMRWAISSAEDLEAMFGPDVKVQYNKNITEDQAKQLGMIDFGDSTELANFDEDPFSSWATTMEREAAVAPWILDDDYQALISMAALEGRQLTDAEIQSTGWWKGNNEAQREWMKLWNGDKETALQKQDDNRIRTEQQLKDAGIENPTEAMISYMADQVTMGNWSASKFLQQVTAASDPYSGYEIDAGLSAVIAEAGVELGVTQEKEDVVRSMLNEWLGPAYGDWSDEEIAKAAGELRNDPDGQIALEAKLKGQRMSLFPTYEDENLTYQDIASPWRTYASNLWGEKVDETDDFFSKLLQNNDAQLNGQLLRQEGLNRGIGKVEQDAQKSMLATTGGSVRRAL